MSIIIKGIDLNDLAYISIEDDGTVYKLEDIMEVVERPMKEVKAIQIPKRHGKLIPLEDVFRAFPELEPYRQGLAGLTILEAEEGQ